MNATIRTLTLADIPAAMELKNRLGWNQTPADWRRFLRLSPEGALALFRGRELFGTALAFVFDRVCWIGMVMVEEAYRGLGYGTALMQRCLGHADSRRCDLVRLDATAAGIPLYARLGFRIDSLVSSARGPIHPPDPAEGSSGGVVPDRAGGAAAGARGPVAAPALEVRRAHRRDLVAMVELDAMAVGAVREPLLHALLADNPERGLVCRDSAGRLEAFLLHRPGLHWVQVGPLIARSDAAAAAVLEPGLREICAAASGQEVSLTVPSGHESLDERLRAWGLDPNPRLTRMIRGRKRLHAREQMVYAGSGPEKG